MRGFLVRVEPKDTHLGQRNNCTDCPVALAIARDSGMGTWSMDENPEGVRVEVLYDRILIWEPHNWRPFRFRMPMNVKHWVQDFDMGLPVRPLSFYLDPWRPPDESYVLRDRQPYWYEAREREDEERRTMSKWWQFA